MKHYTNIQKLMSLDYATLNLLRQNHPAWRLLCSDHAPLVASFLERAFVTPNRRAIAEAECPPAKPTP